jgi:hypothetical protein
MKKIFAIVCVLVLVSCGSRKVNKTNIEKSIDSTSKVTIVDTSFKNTQIKDTSYVIKNVEIDEFEVCPISDSLPIIINGVSYKNAYLKIKKTKDNSLYSSGKITSENEGKQVEIQKEDNVSIKEEENVRDVDRDNTYGFFIMLIFVAVVIYLIDRYGKNK